jgi:hypothetical protein
MEILELMKIKTIPTNTSHTPNPRFPNKSTGLRPTLFKIPIALIVAINCTTLIASGVYTPS